ncbi:MAG: RNA polymerase sigma factor [Planctomycetales bacterium]|nr:RNA polymerase sigma factor [Planctomycetales bacterium]
MNRNLTSITLLARLRSPHDGAAWQRFQDTYGGLLLALLRSLGVQEQDAEDVRQEVLRVALEQLPHFEHNGRPGAFRNWLRQVTANRLKQHWRQLNRHQATGRDSECMALSEQLVDPHSNLSQRWDAEARRLLCEQLMSQVESEFKPETIRAFRVVRLEGHSPKEAAELLGVTANAVRVNCSRVLARLRELGEGMVEEFF